MSGSQRDGVAAFDRIALIGIGLIGSSISKAARRAGFKGTLAGTARSARTRKKALDLGLIDVAFDNPGAAVRDADLVLICVPVGASGDIAKAIAPHLKAGAIVSDVGSVKGSVVRDIAPHMPDHVHFIAGHPIAGTEDSGPEAGFAELFDNRWCILTPRDTDDAAAIEKLAAFWRALGSHVETMTPEHHDMVLATVSHLPHLIAFNIVNSARHLEQVTDSEVIKFSAGGFRDFTRIAASDPVMWRDIFLNNKDAVLEMLGRFSEDLSELQRAIRYGDAATLERLFGDARVVRKGIIESGQDIAAPDFGRNAGGAGEAQKR